MSPRAWRSRSAGSACGGRAAWRRRLRRRRAAAACRRAALAPGARRRCGGCSPTASPTDGAHDPTALAGRAHPGRAAGQPARAGRGDQRLPRAGGLGAAARRARAPPRGAGDRGLATRASTSSPRSAGSCWSIPRPARTPRSTPATRGVRARFAELEPERREQVARRAAPAAGRPPAGLDRGGVAERTGAAAADELRLAAVAAGAAGCSRGGAGRAPGPPPPPALRAALPGHRPRRSAPRRRPRPPARGPALPAALLLAIALLGAGARPARTCPTARRSGRPR